MAVALGMAAAALLVFAAVVGPDSPSPWVRACYLFALWTGPLLLLFPVGIALRFRLAAALRRTVIDIAGPGLVRAMPPRTVLTALLPSIYGERVRHEDLITGLLGGGGRDSSGRDTAVSRGTDAHFRLSRIGDSACLSELTWTHDYSGVQDNHQFVVFATWNREIAGLVVSRRVFPLFELWVVDDEDELEEFVPRLRANLAVGITYRDSDGLRHVVDPEPHHGEEVALRHHDRFVRLPDGIDRKDLRIVQLDLHDLTDADHVVDAVERLTLRAMSVAPFERGYLVWSPPHPCYVRSVIFDVSGLTRPGEDVVYLVIASTIKRAGLPINRWTRSTGSIEVPVDSWMMSGHGVTLLWRPVEGGEHDGPRPA